MAPVAFTQPLGGSVIPHGPIASSSDRVVLVETDAGVRIREGVVQPLYDGRPAPGERVTFSDDDFRVTGDRGETLVEVSVARHGDTVRLNWIWLPRPYLSATLPRLGLTVRGLSEHEGAAVPGGREAAVVVTEVVPGTPSAAAGLQSGDILTGAGTRDRMTPLRLLAAVRTAPRGEVNVRLLRNGRSLTRTLLGCGVAAADGEIVAGDSHLDESLLTGEFLPVARGTGDPVRAGSLNTGEPFDMQVTRTGMDTLVSGIARLLERAQAERPPLARVADRVAMLYRGGVRAVGTPEEMKSSEDPVVRAFVEGRVDLWPDEDQQ